MAEGPAASTFSPGPNTKLGAMKKKCGGFQKWAVRYLILDKPNRILYYYHSPKDMKPTTLLDLNTCAISRLSPEESPKDPGFKVSQPGVRDYIFVGNNAAVVDDWVNAIFQAKAPSPTQPKQGASSANMSTGAMPADGAQSPASENFSYNGPTLAVLPNRNSAAEPPALPANVKTPTSPTSPTSPVSPGGANSGMKQPTIISGPQAPSARSTQTTGSDAGNETLVGNGPDGNSTLVANGGSGQSKPAPGSPVPVLILTPDNKKFPPIERVITGIVKIGRYVGSQPQSDDMITFKSKVISRNHAEIWAVNGDVYIRDTRSQSGTFLNAMRLSEPSKESKPYRLKPGDVIQFGVDYKGATEDNARCVSIRVDLKTRIVEGSNPGAAQFGRAGNEDATLVGGAGGAERTLVGNGDGGKGGPPGQNRPPPGAMPNNYRPPMAQNRPPPMQQPGARPPMNGPPGAMARPPPGQRPMMQQQSPQMMGARPPVQPGMAR